MKLLVASDFHGNVGVAKALADKKLGIGRSREVDAAIICGDLSEFGSLDKGVAILEELKKGFETILYVTGNHDPPSLIERGKRVSENELQKYEPVTCLHGNVVRLRDTTLVGLSGFFPPFYGRWDVEGSPITRDEEAERFLDGLFKSAINELHGEERTMVLVTHDPPLGVCDRSVLTKASAGSAGIRRAVAKWKPAAVCCGHIHEGRGVEKLDETIVVNPGSIHLKQIAYLELGTGGKVVATLSKI